MQGLLDQSNIMLQVIQLATQLLGSFSDSLLCAIRESPYTILHLDWISVI
jgi:hypothetical protein